MPYELTCPSCGNRVASAFVRVGAVVVCEKCNHRYRIEENHVERKVRAAAFESEDRNGALVNAKDDDAENEQLVRQATDGRIIGLSGLSEMMRAEPTSGESEAGANQAGLAPPTARPAPASTHRSGQSARRMARLRKTRVLYTLLGAVVLMLALLGAALGWALLSRGPAPKPTTASKPATSATAGPPAPAPSQAEIDTASHADEPVLSAHRLAAARWKRIDKPYEIAYHGHDPAWVTDEGRVLTSSAQEVYAAKVRTQAAGVITAATLRLAMVNADNRAVILAQTPLGLFGKGRETSVRVPLPVGLPDGLIADARVQIHRQLSKGVYLDHVSVRPIASAGQPPMVLVTLQAVRRAYNRLVLVITASRSENHPIARWRVKLSRPIARGKKIAFRVRTPLPSSAPQMVRWNVEAAGSPVPPGAPREPDTRPAGARRP